MGEQFVIDIHGNTVARSKCRKYKDGYYLKNVDCVKINDKWYRLKLNQYLKFDHETKKWVNSNNVKLINGIVEFKDNNPVYGYFSPNIAKNVLIYSEDGNNIPCMNINIIKDLYTERLDNGVYYHNSIASKLPHLLAKKRIGAKYSHKLEYKCDSLLPTTTDYFHKYFTPPVLALEGTVNEHIYDVLKNKTFGIEYETYDGMVPENRCLSNGLIPVKDGSLRRNNGIGGREYISFEYSSIVLSGKKGLQAIKKQCELLNKYCVSSYKESLHVHIGNIPVSKEFVVSAYKTLLYLQEELYSMFPPAMRDTSEFKNKSYCRPLPNINFSKDVKNTENDFAKIYEFLLDGADYTFEKFGIYHPHDRGNHSKWNIHTRYYLVNFIPLIFNPQQTLEFRIHPATFDADSITNWLFTINAIVTYAYLNRFNNISPKITLEEVFDYVYAKYPLLRTELTKYVTACKKDSKFKLETYDDRVGRITNISWKDQISNRISLV